MKLARPEAITAIARALSVAVTASSVANSIQLAESAAAFELFFRADSSDYYMGLAPPETDAVQ